MKTVGRTAISGSPSDLLPPCAETVVALAEALGAGPNAVPLRALLLRDPGALVVFLRLASNNHSHSTNLIPDLADDRLALPLWTALDQASSAGFADWQEPAAMLTYRFSQCAALIARHFAHTHTGSAREMWEVGAEAPADAAVIASLLSPLGWFVAQQTGKSSKGQIVTAALTRRLARAWSLPPWLANILLSLDLEAPLAGPLACDARLLWTVQAAIALAREQVDPGFTAPVGNDPDAALTRLGLERPSPAVLRGILDDVPSPPASAAPSSAPLLLRLGRLAVRAPAAAAPQHNARLEEEAEQLRQRLAELQHSDTERLRDMKLRALAEFAAGAGHEINNPLAVISGQAQHLLKAEENLDRARALERIIAQCQRIHALLCDMMLYARPPHPKLRMLSLNKLLAEVQSELAGYALERRVSLQSDLGGAKIRLRADDELLRGALVCLLRNAIEAAPAEGWASVRLVSTGSTVAIVVEDSGPGLSPYREEHLFDPFFSNRAAGRGAGLGLSKTWRVAQLHGGAVEAHTAACEPTRFVLTLPLRKPGRPPLRQKAVARHKRPLR